MVPVHLEIPTDLKTSRAVIDAIRDEIGDAFVINSPERMAAYRALDTLVDMKAPSEVIARGKTDMDSLNDVERCIIVTAAEAFTKLPVSLKAAVAAQTIAQPAQLQQAQPVRGLIPLPHSPQSCSYE